MPYGTHNIRFDSNRTWRLCLRHSTQQSKREHSGGLAADKAGRAGSLFANPQRTFNTADKFRTHLTAQTNRGDGRLTKDKDGLLGLYHVEEDIERQVRIGDRARRRERCSMGHEVRCETDQSIRQWIRFSGGVGLHCI